MGNIPKSKSKEEILEEFAKRTGKVRALKCLFVHLHYLEVFLWPGAECPSEKHLHMFTNLLVLRAVELISGFQVDSHVHLIYAHIQESSCLLQLNEYEIQRGKKLGVTISYNNHRLFVGNIPKNRERLELYEEFAKHARKLTSVSQVVSGLWVCQS